MNFIIDKCKSINGKKYLIRSKVKKNKSFFKICATICHYLYNGIYEIIVEKKYKLYHLNKYDIYIVGNNLLKKNQEKVWDNIYLEI